MTALPRALTLEGAGDTISLESDEFAALNGATGFILPPVENRWRDGAGNGSTWRGTRVLRRPFLLPILVRGRDADELAARLERLAVILDSSTAGPAVLRQQVGTESWWVRIVREAGGDPVWGEGTNGSSWAALDDLVVVAPDPAWTRERAEQHPAIRPARGRGLLKAPAPGEADVVVDTGYPATYEESYTGGTGTGGGGGPVAFGEGVFGVGPFGQGSGVGGTPTAPATLTALRQSAAQAMGLVTMDNTGSAMADVVTVVQGPATGVDLIGPDGDPLIWRGALLQGESLRFDHRAGTVTDQAGANRYGGLQGAPVFWGLRPGRQQVRVVLYGADSDTSAVIPTWRPRRWVMV